jgi:hypothetical protein
MYDSVPTLITTRELQAVLNDLDKYDRGSLAALHVQWAIDLLNEEIVATGPANIQ